MSIGKWRFSSSRKQSTSSSRNCDTTTTTTMTSSSSTPRTSTPTSPTSPGGNSNRSSKTSSSSSSSPFSWFRSSHRRSKKRKSTLSPDDPAFARLHKPFTPLNLEHQKLLNAFEWNFGGNEDDDDDHDYDGRRRRRRSSLSISPCATREATVDNYAHGGCDYGYGPGDQYGRHHHHVRPPNDPQNTLSSSLAHLSMREVSDGKYDRTNAA